MKHLILALLVCSAPIITLTAQNTNQNSKDSSLQASDKKFVAAAAESGLTEKALGKLGHNQGSATQVKEYGRMMEQDHSKANEELRDLANRHHMTLPSALPAAIQKKHDDLKTKSGKDFDQAFMKQMIEDHQKAISLFENEVKNGQNEQIRTWAKKTLPTLKQHLQQAQKINDEL